MIFRTSEHLAATQTRAEWAFDTEYLCECYLLVLYTRYTVESSIVGLTDSRYAAVDHQDPNIHSMTFLL